VLRIGVISDTHGLLRSEVEQRLAGVAHIVHAGDIGSPNVIAGLQRIAPVIAIRGNVDTGHWAEQYPETQMVTLGRCCIYVLHDIQTLQLDPVSSGIDVVVCGHSHRPRIETIRGVLYFNPGSAGPWRFNLPVAVATLDLTAGGSSATHPSSWWCKLIGWRQGRPIKRPTKRPIQKLAERSKALICMREFERKFGTGALHPLQCFHALIGFVSFYSDKPG
jgi:putative phosphoesterase